MPTITYQNGRFLQDGNPLFVIAADYQYYRDRRENWADRLTKLKELGVNVVTFYTPWRHHLAFDNGRLWYDFNGHTKDSRDLVTFLKTIEEVGLWMIFKPGPFVHSELNIGGLPDLVSPTFNPAIPPLRRFDGSPVRWSYDNTVLPAPCDPTFDALVRDWLAAVSPLVAPYARPGGPLVAIQLNDETIYCTSNDPPWRLGYEPSAMRVFHEQLAEQYGSIDHYNQLHGTDFEGFHRVNGPRLVQETAETRQGAGNKDRATGGAAHFRACPGSPQSAFRSPQSTLSFIDWAEHQWRLRRDCYLRYKEYVNIDVPYLTNYAGITPPIEENVPDIVFDPADSTPPEFAKTYSDWWLAMNRVDQDADRGVHEYGMISWLGVAAYDVRVFDRYVNTARRRRGMNMEENWGFAALYDKRSKKPIVPVFQTLVSLAAGATGYDIYTGTSTDYWDDSLDRVTKKQCPTFPSDAPINEHGEPGVLYDAAARLNRWFQAHGGAFLACDPLPEAAYLLYAPYAAVASWIPDARHWPVVDHDLPRCGYEAFESWSSSLQRAGYSPVFRELEGASVDWMLGCGSVAIHVAFFMGKVEQETIAEFVRRGGRLFISGELPAVDLGWQPCTALKDAVNASGENVVYRRENLFADGRFADRLADAGMPPRVSVSDNLRALVHYGEQDQFVFFFNLDEGGPHKKWIDIDRTAVDSPSAGDRERRRERIELQLGSKTCGVLRITNGRLAAWFVKGENEVDATTADVRIRFGDQTVEGRGDFAEEG